MELPVVNPKQFLDNKIASYQYFDFPEDGEKINGMILGVPRKDVPEVKSYDDDIMDFDKLPIDLAAGYSPLIPEGLRDKYKREADIDRYLKNIERLRKRGLV